MFTVLDKAVVGFIVAALAVLNTKYGFHFDTGPDTSSVLTSLVDAAVNGLVGMALVYIVPNKDKAKK